MSYQIVLEIRYESEEPVTQRAAKHAAMIAFRAFRKSVSREGFKYTGTLPPTVSYVSGASITPSPYAFFDDVGDSDRDV